MNMKMTLEDMITYAYCSSHLSCKEDCPYKDTRLCNRIEQIDIMEFFENVYEILSMIQNINEKSASKCWETINIIKEDCI